MIGSGHVNPGTKTVSSPIGSRLGRSGEGPRTRAYEQKRNRPVLVLGQAFFVILTITMAFPIYLRNTQQFTALYVAISLFYVLLAAGITRQIVRPLFPVTIILCIQVWMIICYLAVSPYVVPLPIVGRHLYWPILTILPYFALGSICLIDPSFREKALKILFYFCLINALVGIGQFLRLPGFHALQVFFSPGSMGLDYFGDMPNQYRAVGFTLHPYHLAAQCVFGMAVVGSNLLERKLRPTEVLSLCVFLAATFVAQSRAYYVIGFITVVVIMVLMFRKDKPLFVWGTAAIALAALALVVFFPERLSYGISGQNTIQFGRLDRWRAAANLVQEFPITGIGPSTDLFGNDTLNLPTRRNLLYTENGYRMLAGTAGIPGLLLLLAGLVGSFILAMKAVLKRSNPIFFRRMGFVGALYVASIALALGITNMFEYELLTFLGMCTAAFMVPELRRSGRPKWGTRPLGYGFKNGPAGERPSPQ